MVEHEEPWSGSVNEAVVEEWCTETTPFERVHEVLRSTTEPAYASAFADRARVSEPTARTHLETLADTGVATAVPTGRGTKYVRSRESLAMERVRDLHERLSREELTAGIRDVRDRLAAYADRHDAAGPDDLALRLSGDDEAGWTAVSDWRALERDLAVAQAALALYDFDPDDRPTDRGSHADEDRDSRGALADDRDRGATA
ncbi:DUF7342 family protein [Haloparvum sedimenti]|uniref:DUF7342 family protein n=1 Tax=Haloparvum sedimenti TaxID=1678448 RepID=UPI00071E6D91|nr:hypothetical protein [Haloparvum sedimenti]